MSDVILNGATGALAGSTPGTATEAAVFLVGAQGGTFTRTPGGAWWCELAGYKTGVYAYKPRAAWWALYAQQSVEETYV